MTSYETADQTDAELYIRASQRAFNGDAWDELGRRHADVGAALAAVDALRATRDAAEKRAEETAPPFDAMTFLDTKTDDQVIADRLNVLAQAAWTLVEELAKVKFAPETVQA